MTKTTTLQQEFEEYLKAVYPDTPCPGEVQYDQLRQAWFAACLVAYSRNDLREELEAFLLDSLVRAELLQDQGGQA